MNPRIRDAAIGLMSRDHIGDVRRLDSILGKKESATLSSFVPPNPYVGNPSNLIPGKCVALIGINPRYNHHKTVKPIKRFKFKHFEIDIPVKCQIKYNQTNDFHAFDPWFEKLHRYFDDQYFTNKDGEKVNPYYGEYFTKIGNHIGRAWYTAPAEGEPANANARRVLSHHVLKLDAVPYYSVSDKMDANKIIEAMQGDPAMRTHRRLMETLFQECRPRHLQVNGKTTAGSMIKAVFGEIDSFESIGKGKSSIEVGWGKIGHHKLPILIHGFTNVSGGPQSAEAFLECANHFDDWLKDQL